jgi:putative membrane protein
MFTPNAPAQRSCEVEVDTAGEGKPVGDLRDYLAGERTFLAWLRTGIGLMGFGFVAAHFELFADEPHVTQYASGFQTHGLPLWFGAALVLMGVVVNLLSLRRYTLLVGELNRGQFIHRSLSREAVIVAVLLALLGIAMAIYLTPFLAQPPVSLHAYFTGCRPNFIGEADATLCSATD